MKKVSFAFLILTILSIITIIIAEICVCLLYPKYAYMANENSMEWDSFRIRGRKANNLTPRKHVDRDVRFNVIYNNLAMRHNRNFDSASLEGAFNIAVFGDSFTENVRLPIQYVFTEILDYALNNIKTNKKFNVLNFGVDSYGTGQSFSNYIERSRKIKFDHVFYILCQNDIKDIYTNQLYKLNDKGELQHFMPKMPASSGFFKKLIAKSYLTYFVLERYYAFKLGKRGSAKYKYRKAKGRELQTAFDKQADDNTELTKVVKIFESILKEWQALANKNGAKFTIVTLPRKSGIDFYYLKQKGFDMINTFELMKNDIPNFTYEEHARFKNDPHWDENGNYFCAKYLYNYLAKSNKLLEKLNNKKFKNIAMQFYSAFDSSYWFPENMNRIKLAKQTKEKILQKYNAITSKNF